MLDTQAFSTYLGNGSGLPPKIDTRYPFPALLTTPGAGKSRLLHELCAHPLVREAAAKRDVDIVPLHITFNCHSGLKKGNPTEHTIGGELVARILLDASAAAALDDRFYSYSDYLSCKAAVRLWIEQRVRAPSRDVVIVMVVDDITLVKVCFVMSALSAYFFACRTHGRRHRL